MRRERRGTSHGLSIRVARGLYYRPSTFRSRPIEWEETVHADTGLLVPIVQQQSLPEVESHGGYLAQGRYLPGDQ